MNSNVLVTNVQIRSGLAAMRSLGSKGIQVTGADSDKISSGFFSKYCNKSLVYPDPQKYPELYVQKILDEIERIEYDLIMPINDHTLLPLAKNKKEIEQYTRFPFLDYDKLLKGRDKVQTINEAQKCGIRVPITFLPEHITELENIVETIQYPLIIRPVESSGSRGLFKVNNSQDLFEKYNILAPKYGRIMVQEYIPWGGMTFDVGVLMNTLSFPRAVFVSNRIRTYPVEAGPNVVGQGVIYPEVRDMALKLLKHLKWEGPAQVEFRIDPRDNRPVLMEINPRFWGSMYLGMISGIDFPYLFYKMAIEGDIENHYTYKTDMKARWLMPGDILHLVYTKEKKKTIGPWLKDFIDRKVKGYTFSWDDLGPSFGLFLAMATYSIDGEKMEYLLRRSKK